MIGIKPWHDVPECPDCKARATVMRQLFQSPHGARLRCTACGHVWIAGEAEALQAAAADAAWRAEMDRQYDNRFRAG